MKNILLILSFLFISFTSIGQTKVKYTEFNTGISVGKVAIFPGASLLVGKTLIYKSGLVFDYECGLAIPSIITGKVGFGYMVDENAQVTVGVRPWPTATYLQMEMKRPEKRTNLVFSVEKMWGDDLFIQKAIFTIGWRHSIVK